MVTKTLVIFAAGKGTRMMPLTDYVSKPLVHICSKPILYWNIDMAKRVGIRKVIVNSNSKSIFDAVSRYYLSHIDTPRILVSYERELLETGGTIKSLQDLLDDEYVFTLNSDSIFINMDHVFTKMSNFTLMQDPDILILSKKKKDTLGFKSGDFSINNNNITLDKNAKYVHSGIQLIKPQICFERVENVFSLRSFYVEMKKKVMTVLDTKGKCFHISEINDINATQNAILKYENTNYNAATIE